MTLVWTTWVSELDRLEGSADGVTQIELTSPAASEQSRLDCEAICKLGLKAKVCYIFSCHCHASVLITYRFLLI